MNSTNNTAFLTPVSLPSQLINRPITTRCRRSLSSPARVAITRAVAAPPHTNISAPNAATPIYTGNYLVTVLLPSTNVSILPSIISILENVQGTVIQSRPLSDTATEFLICLPPSTDVELLRSQLYTHGLHFGVDIVLQREDVVRTPKRLAVFDLDSTLITQETIVELASELNLQSLVSDITHRAMNGEINFRQALEERVALLEGLPHKALDTVKERVEFTPGAKNIIAALRSLGCKTAVVSGGFHFLADHVRDVLGLDYSFANRLQVDDNDFLTGLTTGEIVDAEYKERTLLSLAKQFGLEKDNVVAVGDGSNDLLMLGQAGLGVAFNAKPVVQNQSKHRVNQSSLENVLYLLGLSDTEINVLLQNSAVEP